MLDATYLTQHFVGGKLDRGVSCCLAYRVVALPQLDVLIKYRVQRSLLNRNAFAKFVASIVPKFLAHSPGLIRFACLKSSNKISALPNMHSGLPDIVSPKQDQLAIVDLCHVANL